VSTTAEALADLQQAQEYLTKIAESWDQAKGIRTDYALKLALLLTVCPDLIVCSKSLLEEK
jgi:hypothetical protein